MTSAPATSSDALALLKRFHERLDVHFRALHERRQRLEPPGPVFALEHGLEPAEFALLQGAVRAAIANGFGVIYRTWWLPFVVYAADVGYDYVGKDYWPPFAERTPGWEAPNSGWDVGGHRTRLRNWFLKFANEYGGARPTGAFADWFINIAWPIVHAVLPIYLQRQLAQLLDEFANGQRLTNDLLDDPDALGEALAGEAYRRDYPERFQKFCSQKALLGRIATALLAGEEEETRFLLRSTLQRIVDGVMSEQKARIALQSARRSASRVRTSGFRPASPSDGARNAGHPRPDADRSAVAA